MTDGLLQREVTEFRLAVELHRASAECRVATSKRAFQKLEDTRYAKSKRLYRPRHFYTLPSDHYIINFVAIFSDCYAIATAL